MSNTDLKNNRYIVFMLSDEYYAVDIMIVKTVEKLLSITRVPKVKDYISGIINLRGEIIPAIELRRRFGMIATTSNDDTRIIVLKLEETQIALIVDFVDEVMEIPNDIIESGTTVNGFISSNWITGVARVFDKVITILNFDKIIKVEDF
jgi:purine-binding chemotaxis protein CheW